MDMSTQIAAAIEQQSLPPKNRNVSSIRDIAQAGPSQMKIDNARA